MTRRLGALFLVLLFFCGQTGFAGFDAVVFHGIGPVHPMPIHVESTQTHCHADHCMLGFTPASARPTPPVARAVDSAIARQQPRQQRPGHIPHHTGARHQPPSRAPPSQLV